MKNIIALLLVFGSTVLVGQSFESLDAFNSVKISGNIEAVLKKSDNNGVEVEMLEGEREKLKLSVEEGRLFMKIKSNGWSSKGKAKVTIFYNGAISSVNMSAGSRVSSTEELTGDKIKIDVSSGASAEIGLSVTKAVLSVSSGGSLNASGDANKVNVECSSGGSVVAMDLKAKKVNAEVSSGGSIKVYAMESINAEASSGGSIVYGGNPKDVNEDKGYSGSIEKY